MWRRRIACLVRSKGFARMPLGSWCSRLEIRAEIWCTHTFQLTGVSDVQAQAEPELKLWH